MARPRKMTRCVKCGERISARELRKHNHPRRMPITGYALSAEEDLPGSEPYVIGEFVQLIAAQTALSRHAMVAGRPLVIRTMRNGFMDEACYPGVPEGLEISRF